MIRRLALALLVYFSAIAHATNYPIIAGSSQSTIQSTINTAAAASGANTVTFAAGSYSVTSISGSCLNGVCPAINVPCPVGSLVITGPVTTYLQPGVAGAWSARPTATINNATAGEAAQIFGVQACTTAITIQYLELNGNKPTSGGGGIAVYGGNLSGLSILYNWIHGNQEVTPYLCDSDTYWCYGDNNASLIWMQGSHGSTAAPGTGGGGSGTLATNVLIANNIFGNVVPGNPAAGDCGNVMSFIGGTIAGGSFLGYDTTGSECSSLFITTSTNNMQILNNTTLQQEQGWKFVEGGSPYNGDGAYSLFFQVNDKFEFNDIGYYHRIGLEDQQSSVNYSPNGGTCSLDSAGACMWHVSNSMHDNIAPSYGNWGFSLANTGYWTANDNVVISNNNINGGAGPGDWEDYSTYLSISNNLEQGWISCGVQYGGSSTTEPNNSIQNNNFQLVYGQSCGNLQFGVSAYFNGTPPIPANFTGNVGTTTASVQQSAAPSFSPSGGSFSGSTVNVTLHDTGNPSPGPLGNTGIWYTTDGSTPGCKTGTSIYAPDGYTITIPIGTTLKAVGMWGAQNQPCPAGTATSAVTYPAGYGYSTSGVVSAQYLSSGTTPTLTGITLAPSGSNVTVGSSLQITAQCSYTGSITTNCGQVADAYGTLANTWLSSVPADASISSSGVLTALAAGSTNITAKAATFTSPALAVTIMAAAPTLTGVTITDGGVGTLSVGQTVQAHATAQYNSGAITTNCSATADAYGTTCGTWTSSVPADATISGTGLITAVAVGNVSMTVKAVNGTTSITSPTPLTLAITTAVPPSATLASVAVTCGTGTSVPVGQTIACAATCTYNLTAGGTTTTNCTTTDAYGTLAGTWASSSTGVATINSGGMATGVAAGTTNITVHAGSFTSPNFALQVTPSTTGNVLGNNQYDSAGVTYPGAYVATYAISPTNTSSVSFLNLYLPTGTYANGIPYDIVLVLAPTPTTEASSAICFGTYTTVGTTADAGWHQVTPTTSCGNIPASTAYWVGSVTTGSGVGLGFWDCNGGATGCAGAAPAVPGTGTYPFRVSSVNRGTYTSLPATMSATVGPGGTGYQASAYATLTTPKPTLTGGNLATPSGVNVIPIGSSVQFTAFCGYSDGTLYQCYPTADQYGNTVTSFASSAPSVVSVGNIGSARPGLATALAYGTSNISAVLTGSINTTPLTLTVSSCNCVATPASAGKKKHK